MKIPRAFLLDFMNIEKTVFFEECSKNYVDLVKGYAETIQEQFPSFETMQLPKREKREILNFKPEVIKRVLKEGQRDQYDNERFNFNLNREFGKF